jgi:hypothetical protein
MPSSINLDNNTELFNIFLDAQGRVHFNANSTDGGGDTRVSINDDNGIVTIGGTGDGGTGAGQFGGIQLKSPNNANTIFIGATGTQANALLGGGTSGFNGVVRLGNAQGTTTIDMQGSSGTIQCVNLIETSDLRLKKGIAPLLNTLDKVLAMRGVRYQSKQEDLPKEAFGEDSQIGFIGQEMETVCPEIVSTDSEGYKSINYSRLTPILVEAIKEQQQLIQRQASALQEAVEKIAWIETAMKEQSA